MPDQNTPISNDEELTALVSAYIHEIELSTNSALDNPYDDEISHDRAWPFIAARAVLSNLMGRSGSGLDQIEMDIRADIVTELAAIIYGINMLDRRGELHK